MTKMDLRGKTALITGSTGKIGRFLAESLAREGVQCLCQYHRQDRLANKLVQGIRRHGGRAFAFQSDFRDAEQIRRLFQEAGRYGPTDILIHSAGLFEKTPLKNCTEQQIEDLIHLNLTVPLLITRLFVKSRFSSGAKKPFAKVLFFADIGALRPWRDYSAYCAAKAGLIAATQSLAKELAPGIAVNAIAPGIVEGTIRNRQEAAERKKRIPLGRFVPMNDLMEAVLFLLKTDSITGEILTADGGAVL
ncbi:MAG: SDR family oxidoreductase [Anaerohalosphaeraceae bacterium]